MRPASQNDARRAAGSDTSAAADSSLMDTTQVPVDVVRPPRRKGRATRDKLVAAAVALLQSDGPAALTTTRLTQAVGIVQSGFYVHFANIQEITEAAAESVAVDLRHFLQQNLAGLRRPGHDSLVDLEQHFFRVYGDFGAAWPALELVLRHRRDPSALGERFRVLFDGLHREVADHLVLLAEPIGYQQCDQPAIDLLARCLVDVAVDGLECLHSDPAPGDDLVVRLVAANTEAMVLRTFAELGFAEEAP